MTTTLNKEIIESTFNCKFEEQKFYNFIKNVFPTGDFSAERSINLDLRDYTDFVKSAKRICKYKYQTEEFENIVVDVLIVKLKKESSIERARVAQRNFIATYLNGGRNYPKDGALVAFISEDENGNISPDWRFSFVQMNYETKIVEDANGKTKRKTYVELTPPKRFSFLVGESEYTHTAQTQFLRCLDKATNGELITVADIVEAFDIEKVSKEFFDKYKALYKKLTNELDRLCKEDKDVREDFKKHNVIIEDFAKKTMGQLVFLYFIQKKGWLGVDKDKDWGTGDKKFLRHLFDGEYYKYENFFNDILEPLFYEALAKDRGQASWFKLFNCCIPFLNGGLFEPVNGYKYQITNLTISNEIFKEIFDTFDLYNFTVKEDEPLEKEVAIDPEMLGKVFENLLPENERKGNGAYYTPREIVHYMCQESLINYLMAKVNELENTNGIISKEDISYFIKRGDSTYKNENVDESLPISIANNAKVLDNALANIKVCDPAIGSGAFPVGMMNEIVRARNVLSLYLGEERPIYSLKRNAIENSIYGVDIDPGAVEIAKLRFWLSLVVEENDIKNIKPLPNLDYKIMQGNSLISTFEGIDFDKIVEDYKIGEARQTSLFEGESVSIITNLKYTMKYFVKTSDDGDKQKLKVKIENLITDLVKVKFEEKAIKNGKEKGFYEDKIRNFAQNKEKREFFPWKLFFSDAFENGGFDVVIANPPYVGEKGHKDIFDPILTGNLKKFHLGKMDLFYFFFHLALNILKNSGHCTFITTNYYITALGAKKLRYDFKNRAIIKNLINFNELKIFESALGQHNLITMLQKGQNCEAFCNIINVNRKGFLDSSFNSIVNKLDENTNYNKIIQKELYDGEENYIRIFQEESNSILSCILNKIKKDNSLLGDICNVNQGLRTGADKVLKTHKTNYDFEDEIGKGIFVLNDDEINSLKPNKDELNDIIKKFYKNSDIKDYYTSNLSSENLLYIDKTLTEQKFKEKYPNIIKYLLQFKNLLLKIRERNNERLDTWFCLDRTRVEKIFKFPKIVVPQRSKENNFGYNESDWYASADVYFITEAKTEYKLKYILSLLNSNLYYIWLYNKGKRKGEALELYQKPLSEIPIKKVNEQIQDKFVSIVDKILAITQNNDYLENQEKQNAVKKYEKQIDKMVYKLYGLTYEEVKTIDINFSMAEEEYNNYVI